MPRRKKDFYCGNRNLPRNYERFGERYECLRRGVGVGLNINERKSLEEKEYDEEEKYYDDEKEEKKEEKKEAKRKSNLKNRRWESDDEVYLRNSINNGTNIETISQVLKRSIGAVKVRISKLKKSGYIN